MKHAAIARTFARTDVCPYCGQPITREQLEEIRERVRKEEQARLKEVEREMRQRLTAKIEAEAAQLTKRRQELAAREKALGKKAKALAEAARAKYDEGYRRAKIEDQRTQQQLQKQVEDLRRRLERKTADELGTVSEEELLERLQRAYPGDHIIPVPRGESGADVLHEVRDGDRSCGRIVYESKNVKQYLSAHIEKAKSYRTRYDTGYVVLVTTAFPAGERDFCAREGIVLVHPTKVVYIVDILRQSLLEIAAAGAAGRERNTKGERLLRFVTSDEFKERIRGVLDAVDDLRNLQAEERKRHEGTWCAQEEAYRAIEQFSGRIQAQVRAIVEGRGSTPAGASSTCLGDATAAQLQEKGAADE